MALMGIACASPPCEVMLSHAIFKSSLGNVAVDEFECSSVALRGIIVGVHASVGLLSSPTPAFDNLGEFDLAKDGYRVFLIHYLDINGTKSVIDKSLMHREAGRWSQVIGEFVDSLRTDQSPVFLIGSSLGGYLALDVARRRTWLSGLAINGVSASEITRSELPRTGLVLLQNGTNDNVVPIEQARQLCKELNEIGAICRLTSYEGSGHYLIWERHEDLVANIKNFFNSGGQD